MNSARRLRTPPGRGLMRKCRANASRRAAMTAVETMPTVERMNVSNSERSNGGCAVVLTLGVEYPAVTTPG
jgi:hypothetical protein